MAQAEVDLVFYGTISVIILGLTIYGIKYSRQPRFRPTPMRDQPGWLRLLIILFLGILPGILFVYLMEVYDQRLYDWYYGKNH